MSESHDTQKYLQRKGLLLENCAHKMIIFIAFLINERNALVKRCVGKALKIFEKQQIPIEKRRVQRKKKMPGKHAADLRLCTAKEIKRCLVEPVDQFRSEAEKDLVKLIW